MCRWVAYSGEPVYLEELILEPEHSLIDQSLDAEWAESPTNGDGFGVGWYGTREVPGLYRSTRPAWNDPNLRSIASQIESRMFVAHVRSATGGTPVQDSNCHPFRHGKWLFVHNGSIQGYREIRRGLSLGISQELFPHLEGNTDSEVLFFLAITFGLEEDPNHAVQRMIGFVEKTARQHGIENAVQMTLGITDGTALYAYRYSTEHTSRTLFLSKEASALHQINPVFKHFSDDARAVVSEPLTEMTQYWLEIPESTALRVWHGHVEDYRIIPMYD